MNMPTLTGGWGGEEGAQMPLFAYEGLMGKNWQNLAHVVCGCPHVYVYYV